MTPDEIQACDHLWVGMAGSEYRENPIELCVWCDKLKEGNDD